VNAWPWIALAGLGAWHGLNPGMGWLFAVSLGLQNRSRMAIFYAMCAIALGHALSVLAIIVLAFLAGQYVSATWFGLAAGVSLALVGSWRLLRGRHPRWVGMRVNLKDLTWWLCLMASAHGAGLMLLPVFMIGGGAWVACHHRRPLSRKHHFQDSTIRFPVSVCIRPRNSSWRVSSLGWSTTSSG